MSWDFHAQTLVGRLLAEDVDISLTDTQSRTALLHSVIRKHDSITQLLLAHHSALVRNRLNAKGKSTRHALRSVNTHVIHGSRGRGIGVCEVGAGTGAPGVVSDIQVRFRKMITSLSVNKHGCEDSMEIVQHQRNTEDSQPSNRTRTLYFGRKTLPPHRGRLNLFVERVVVVRYC